MRRRRPGPLSSGCRIFAAAFAAVAVGALSAATPALAQTFRVVGFGDSVTHAVGFDVGTSSSCNIGKADTCGYLPRLEAAAYFDCNASKCEFVNRGKLGEKTAQGLTRIEEVLKEKDWDLVILMEGTNDVRLVSAQTIDFNLRQMANKARNRGVGTAHASIIWFHPSIPRDVTTALNQVSDNLRFLIRNQAASSKRCFIDIRNVLCPVGAKQDNCFRKNYWKPPEGVDDLVGHPNARGYDIIAKEFFRVLGTAGEPGAAEILSPSGEACGQKANLSWRKESVAGTTCGNWFRVQVDGAGGNKLDAWYPEGELCTGSDCTLISPVDFEEGTFSIRVRTRNTRGIGRWSKAESFTTVPSAPGKVRKLLAPVGEFFRAGGLVAEFTWSSVSDAKSYRLEVVSSSTEVVFDGSFDGTEACDESTCTVALEEPLPTGKYSWRVMAENICGGTWSDPARLVIFDGPPASAPATVAPAARIFDRTPTFRWQTVFAASEFEIEDAFGTSTTLTAADHCIGGICRFTSRALSPGPYTWRVRGMNPLGAGAWSASVAFQVADCDCLEGSAAGGSSFLLAVPTNWNGDLVLWSHDSNYFGVREIEDFGPLAQRQFDQGYALATTSYSVTGWPLFKSKRDLEKIYNVFVANHGEPTNVYLVGESTGALVALAAVENARLGNLIGALASCGPLAGATNWEAVLDLRLTYDAICSDIAQASIPGGAQGLPKPHDLEPVDIRSAVNFCTGVDRKRPKRSTDQKRRLKALLAINAIPAAGLQDAMQQATFGLYDLVHDKKKLKGRLPVGNEGVDYGSDSLNASIERVGANRKATAKLARYYQLSGETNDTKIISLHTSQDSVFFVENQRDFADLATTTALTTGIVIETEASHCGFNEVELLASWRALTIWAEGGKKPKPKNLQNRCKSLRSSVGGECRFDRRPKIATLDTRIRPRP